MKYSLEQQMDIGRQMYLHEITYKEAMARYDISESCAHKYMTDYKKASAIVFYRILFKIHLLQNM